MHLTELQHDCTLSVVVKCCKKKKQKKNVIEGATAMQLEREFVFQGGYAAYRYAQPATATAAAYSDR